MGKFEHMPFTFKYEGKTFKGTVSTFKPLNEVMYRVSVPNVDVKKEMIFVFNEHPKTKELTFYKRGNRLDATQEVVLKTLRKILEA